MASQALVLSSTKLAEWGRTLVETGAYIGSYLIQAGLAAIATIVLFVISIPRPSKNRTRARMLPVSRILVRPRLLVAVAGGAMAYAVMSALMITTPLAMHASGHPLSSATPVIQWHVVGMFAPSFVTGSLIHRWGASRLMLAGFALILLDIAIALSGIGYWNYMAALTLLGIGWNFAFIGATSLLTQSARPNQLAKVQSVNELLVFGLTAFAGLSAGWLFNAFGWKALNVSALVLVIFALVLVCAYELNGRRKMARLLQQV